jgi:hypothetical protein
MAGNFPNLRFYRVLLEASVMHVSGDCDTDEKLGDRNVKGGALSDHRLSSAGLDEL